MGRLQTIRRTLESHGQQHLLRSYGELAGPQQQALLDQLAGIDFVRLDELIERYVRHRPQVEVP
ncbi:MAG: hypothetical protein WBF17_14915, partial [Phycisphaerae bacterium]